MIDRRGVPVKNSVLVAFDCDAGASLAIVALASHEDTKQGALACSFSANEEDLDIKLEIVSPEFILSELSLND